MGAVKYMPPLSRQGDAESILVSLALLRDSRLRYNNTQSMSYHACLVFDCLALILLWFLKTSVWFLFCVQPPQDRKPEVTDEIQASIKEAGERSDGGR